MAKKNIFKKKRLWITLAVLFVLAGGYLTYSWWVGGWVPSLLQARPGRWAQPIDDPVVSNFYKVSDDLYRGAQPDQEGMKRLESLGIKTVVNLRRWHDDDDELQGTNLSEEHFRMTGLNPDDEDVVDFLRVVMDRDRTPVFLHCKHGSDRTGFMTAAYRVIIQGWDRYEAAREMRDGGFGFHGSVYGHLVKYIAEDMDVKWIKAQLDLE